MYDLKISGGVIVDGTGRPRYRGDVGIRDGRLVDVGDAPESAKVEVDAPGQIVCPGFIDVHTHYDAQVLWDRMLSISPWHGVTTAVMGLCAVGFAPCRERDREYIMRLVSLIEGMSFEALEAGLGDWGFETYPQYLDLIQRRGTAINVASGIGHHPIKIWVMGPDAVERYATDAELAQQQDVLRQALGAGAVAFSVYNGPAHHGPGGKPVPSQLTRADQFERLLETMAEVGRGSFQCQWGPTFDADTIPDYIERFGVPFCRPQLTARPDVHDERIAAIRSARAQGLPWFPEVNPLPMTFEVGLEDPFMFGLDLPLGAMKVTPLHDLLGPITALATKEERLQAYRQPGFRDAFVAATNRPDWNDGYWPFVLVNYNPARPATEGRRLLALAAEAGDTPGAVMFDVALASGLDARFGVEAGNRDIDMVEQLLYNDDFVIGAGDAGAHQGQMVDCRYPTHLLSHWVRERDYPLERAVWQLTGAAVGGYGILDRGVLEPGRAADVVVFDPDAVADGPLRRINDLPGGARRLVSDAIGIEAVIVNGTVIRSHGADAVDPDGPLPGKLLREFLPHAARRPRSHAAR